MYLIIRQTDEDDDKGDKKLTAAGFITAVIAVADIITSHGQ